MQRVLLCLLTTGMLFAQEFKLGSKVDEFALQDVKGGPVQFSALKGEVTLIAFIATKCPVSNAYNERMTALYNDYAPRGVKFVFINANRTEPASEVEQHAAKVGFPFAVYKDDGSAVAERFGATVTPEVFILDKAGAIVYHGSIDDSQELSRVQQKRARAALDDVLAGRQVQTAETKAFGCAIKKGKSAS